MNAQIVQFWNTCCEALPDLAADTPYTVKTYGNTEEMADLLLALIRDGDKTGTFAVDWEFENQPETTPREGDHVIVVDGRGAPGCLYRIDSVQRLPFNQITEAHVACEGPTMRKLAPWKKMHWAYWTRVLDGTGHAPTEDMMVLVQNFSVLYPETDTRP
jgi:uncharacterized protein YhfF